MKESTKVLCVVGSIEQRMKDRRGGREARDGLAQDLVSVRRRGLRNLVAVLRLSEATRLVTELAAES